MNNKIKTIALYLPQFHWVKENSEWWGENFTDWEAVQKSKSLYKGHDMPRVPLNQNYYDLLDINIIDWQAKTARQYGIDGFCIYHYYNNGQLMMNRPAELLLENKSIDIEYFFSWANHDFRETWFGGNGRLLMKQEYGSKDDWINHFEYLVQFFLDKRYIKIENKPVIVIFDILHIPNYEKMFDVWDEKAKKYGFEGLYIIATHARTNESTNVAGINARFLFQPLNTRVNGNGHDLLYVVYRRMRTFGRKLLNKISKKIEIMEFYDYSVLNKKMLQWNRSGKQYYCAFPAWDNTPRYGKKGVVIRYSSPRLFEKYFELLYKRSIEESNDFIFINAWNEWGETAYLEPDELNGYKNLEAVKSIVDKFSR